MSVDAVARVSRGQVWWADLPEPVGSGPGFVRPVVVVQSDRLNQTRIATVVVAILTSNLRRLGAPGNVMIKRTASGLAEDSVMVATQLLTIDRRLLREKQKTLDSTLMHEIDEGLRLILGLTAYQ